MKSVSICLCIWVIAGPADRRFRAVSEVNKENADIDLTEGALRLHLHDLRGQVFAGVHQAGKYRVVALRDVADLALLSVQHKDRLLVKLVLRLALQPAWRAADWLELRGSFGAVATRVDVDVDAAIFVNGAIRAAAFLEGKEAGMDTMNDLLGGL